MDKEIVTERLILRPWQESDAESLYKYARDPEIGPIAGWPPHTFVEDSLNVIRTVFSAPETYAVVLKETGEPVGSAGIMDGEGLHSAQMQAGEAEIGYWIGRPFWGQGLIPEAVRRLQQRCFEELGFTAVWCGYYDGNTKSRRVMDKCGFRFHHTEEGNPSPLGDIRTVHFMRITKAEWEKIEAVKESKEEYVMAKRSADESGSYSRFLSGECCHRLGPEVLEMIAQTTEYLSVLNDIKTSGENREEIISKIFKNFGKYSSVGRNFTCQCGKHISIGEKTIVNDNCTMMDENYIHIGNNVLIAPNVQFYTASHPIDYRERFVENWDESSGELFFRTSALPITVEDNVWIGGGSIILGGITIGFGSVVGAGSVVTKSIPAGCVAAGNPCRIIRRLEPGYKLRKIEGKDIPELQALFRNTVLIVNSKDYTQEEVEDWASCGDSIEHWKELLSVHNYVAALDQEGHIIGFSSMNTEGYLHSMFVHKDWQHKGVASMLLSEVEKMALGYGVHKISAEVSITARPFFEKHGYKMVKEQKAKANRLYLTNYVMKKELNY